MLGVKFKGDKRDKYLQHGGWIVKAALWLLCNALPFFLPNSLVNSYGNTSLKAPLVSLDLSDKSSVWPKGILDRAKCVFFPEDQRIYPFVDLRLILDL